MKPYRVKVQDGAWRELASENAHWNLSLPRAQPDALIDLFHEALGHVAENPEIGPEDERHPGSGNRRLLLLAGQARRVGFWLYYFVDHEHERIEVFAFESTHFDD